MDIKKVFEASYQRPKQAKSTIEDLGYKFDTELSTPKSKVFVDPEGNPHIAFRGTEFGKGIKTAVQDIGTDIMIGLGKTTKREKEAKRLRQQVEQKYGKPSTAYGHSLGGKLAASSGAQQAITYNRAYGLRDIINKAPTQETAYRTKGDIVSLPSKFIKGKKNINVGKKSKNPFKAHELKSFINPV
jgi:hypothetical protein